MNRLKRKYMVAAALAGLWGHMVFGLSPAFDARGLSGSNTWSGDTLTPAVIQAIQSAEGDSAFTVFRTEEQLPLTDVIQITDTTLFEDIDFTIPTRIDFSAIEAESDSIARLFGLEPERESVFPLIREILAGSDTLAVAADSLAADSLAVTAERDTTQKKQFLDDIISGNNKDSLVYDVRNKMVYIYTKGDIVYQDMNLKADYIEADMTTKNIFAYGYEDTTGVKTRPEFYQAGSLYTMDTITYNLDSQKAKIKGVATQEGDGYLIGESVKKMKDNVVNIQRGKYTTCDDLDHPHFYLAMNRAKVIPGKKVVVGSSYFVMEDVPIYFPLLPFGFFPITSGRSSGFITPTFGEESVKGFFIRDGGYYFAINDYIDITALAGIYTLGSWDASVASRYIKKYRFSGTMKAHYSKIILGDKGSADYQNSGQFSLNWSHQQDPKFRPNSTFAASVNFSTSGYNKYSSTNMNDYLNTQTNSSISYSQSWPGKPFSLSTSFSHSQNSRDSTYSFQFPNLTFNVSRIYPFKRKEAIGKAKWYEKISITYTGSLQNSVQVKEKDLFTEKMLKDMRNGINHSVPISATWNLLNYINIGPSANYTERWYFRKIEQDWDPVNQENVRDTTYGFYRLYNFSVSGSASTKIYALFQFKNENFPVRAIRYVMTPNVSFSYTPDFGSPKYGYYKTYQNATGGTTIYSPYSDNAYGVPGRGPSASINFSLANNVEAKIKSDKDTTGIRKIKPIEQLNISSSYNFMADSLNLAPFTVNFKTSIKGNYAINLNMTLDPYQIDENGRKINRFMISQGKLVRLTSASTSFGYTFNSSNNPQGAMNDFNTGIMDPNYDPNYYNDPNNPYYGTDFPDTDPNMRRRYMASQYYDFNIPWNFGFNYTFNYTNTTGQKNVNQTLSFNGSVTLTDKWGLTFSSFGYDFKNKQLTPGTVYITRDLHCWQMNLSWVPIGYRKSWSFNISVKSAVLRDLKYDKSSSFFDNLYD